MPRLWNAVSFGLNDRSFYVVILKDLAVDQRIDAVPAAPAALGKPTLSVDCRCRVSKVMQDVMEESNISDGGGQEPLHVFHDKNGRTVVGKDLKIFNVQSLSHVLFRIVLWVSRVPGAAG